MIQLTQQEYAYIGGSADYTASATCSNGLVYMIEWKISNDENCNWNKYNVYLDDKKVGNQSTYKLITIYLINYVKDFRYNGYMPMIAELQIKISCYDIAQFDTGIREIVEIDKKHVYMYAWRNCIKLNKAEKEITYHVSN